MKGLPEIKEVFAVVCIDKDGTEGVPCFFHPIAQAYFPLYASDPQRIPWLKENMADVAKESKLPMKLVRFSNREIIEEIKP